MSPERFDVDLLPKTIQRMAMEMPYDALPKICSGQRDDQSGGRGGDGGLGLGAQAYGLVLVGGAVGGGVLGSLTGPRIAATLGPARTTQVMLTTSAPALAALALAPGAWTLGTVFAVFEFAGLVWNIVSVSTRQRMIPDAMLGRVNSLYRLLAWGMMSLGLILSGLIVRVADGPLSRSTALTLPFWVAAVGALVLTLAAWRALARGFAGDPDKKI